jgi:hypothetical protein
MVNPYQSGLDKSNHIRPGGTDFVQIHMSQPASFYSSVMRMLLS